jgi:hypothetical protein
MSPDEACHGCCDCHAGPALACVLRPVEKLRQYHLLKPLSTCQPHEQCGVEQQDVAANVHGNCTEVPGCAHPPRAMVLWLAGGPYRHSVRLACSWRPLDEDDWKPRRLRCGHIVLRLQRPRRCGGLRHSAQRRGGADRAALGLVVARRDVIEVRCLVRQLLDTARRGYMGPKHGAGEGRLATRTTLRVSRPRARDDWALYRRARHHRLLICDKD